MTFINRSSSWQKRLCFSLLLMLFVYACHLFINRPSDTEIAVSRVIDGVDFDAVGKQAPPSQSGENRDIDPKTVQVDFKFPPEIEEWQRGHGYFSKDELIVYEGYSNQVLSDLLNDGDIKSAEILGDRVLKSNFDPDYRKRYTAIMFKAAAYGSTRSLLRVAGLSGSGDLHDPKDQRRDLLNDLAIYRTMGMRGDIKNAKNYASLDTDYYKHRFCGFELTDKEKQHIEIMAQSYYKRLEDYRATLGLPAFDNSTPDFIKSHVERDNTQKK